MLSNSTWIDMKKLMIHLRSASFCLLLFFLALTVSAQEIRGLDDSPLDLAIFRPNGQGTQPVARIIYSRPQKKGRKIFGGIVPYDEVWRTGANQSTEINLYRDISFEGKTLKAGSYTMYTVPGEKTWEIIFNTNLHTWGAFDYDSDKNVLSFEVPAKKVSDDREAFGMAFDGGNGKGKLLMAWEKTEVYLSFDY